MSNESLKLELEAFQGPFDLLLHLIKELKVDLNDIPMAPITEQYMAYLKNMHELELNIAGEYLVMAATLLEIKARMLLPIEPIENMDSDYEGDPRDILVQQLLMYQQFQHVATALEIREEQRAKRYMRPVEPLGHYQVKVPLMDGELSLNQLANAFMSALQKEQARIPQERHIEHDPLTVSQKIEEIQQLLLHHQERVPFNTLLSKRTRHEIITTFMAVLEMVRKHSLIFFQEYANAPILIQRVNE